MRNYKQKDASNVLRYEYLGCHINPASASVPVDQVLLCVHVFGFIYMISSETIQHFKIRCSRI